MEIGLVVGLAVVVGTFAWGTPEKNVGTFVPPALPDDMDVIVNTKHEQERPKVKPIQMQVRSDFIEIVRGDKKIESYSDGFPEPDDNWWVPKLPKDEDPVDDGTPLMIAEEMPRFQGGDLNVFRNWVQSRIVYPRMAQENNIQGKVVMKFVIERDGSLTNIEELFSPDRSLTEEVVRVLEQSPKWTPGKQRNKPVRVFYILPIDFTLQQ